jgi:predicted nucleic acid-binding protein
VTAYLLDTNVVVRLMERLRRPAGHHGAASVPATVIATHTYTA